MASFVFAVCFALCLCQNAFAQLGLGNNLGSSNLASKISGNSVVSNNIGIGNFGGADAKTLASKIGNGLPSNIGSNLVSNIGSNIIGKNIGGNNVVSNNIGLNLGSNVGANVNGFGGNLASSGSASITGLGSNMVSSGASTSSFANAGASNLAIGGKNLAGSVGTGFSANRVSNFAGGNTGGSISLGNVPVSGISNFKVGEIELVSDVSANKGYTGELPIIGYVTFEGYIPAEGTVTVANDCGCTS